MAEVVLLPYLHGTHRVKGGPWELIPRTQLVPEDVVEPWVQESTLGLLRLYELRVAGWNTVGCVAKPSTGRIGQAIERPSLLELHRAVVASLLDPNPSLAEREKGHQAATSDNALLFAHRVDQSGAVAVDYGVMVRSIVGGLQVGSEDVSIASPPEIHVPFMHPPIDDLYLEALLSILVNQDEESRRIGRAIDWLDLAWRNTSSIDEDTRIVALRAGFEVLFGVGDKTPDIREALTQLLEDSSVPRRVRTWMTLQEKERSEEMTDLGWWFSQFSFLRNAIMHGQDVYEDEYLHEEQRHLWQAEMTLRRSIKQRVADLTNQTILMDPMERLLRDVDDSPGSSH